MTIRGYIAALLNSYAAEKGAVEKRISDLEAQGYRIVAGGSGFKGPGGVHMIEPFSDWSTGEALYPPEAREDSKLLEKRMEAAWRANNWFHIEAIESDVHDHFYEVRRSIEHGLPGGLADALHLWVSEDEDEARDWLTSTPAAGA